MRKQVIYLYNFDYVIDISNFEGSFTNFYKFYRLFDCWKRAPHGIIEGLIQICFFRGRCQISSADF